jgi:hypothetical protein
MLEYLCGYWVNVGVKDININWGQWLFDRHLKDLCSLHCYWHCYWHCYCICVGIASVPTFEMIIKALIRVQIVLTFKYLESGAQAMKVKVSRRKCLVFLDGLLGRTTHSILDVNFKHVNFHLLVFNGFLI